MEELSCWTRKRNDGSSYTSCKGILRDNEMIKTKQAQLNALKRQYSLQEGMEERDRQAEKSLAEGEDIVATAKKRLDRLGGDKRLAEVKAELAGMKEKDREDREEAEYKRIADMEWKDIKKNKKVNKNSTRKELIEKLRELYIWFLYPNDFDKEDFEDMANNMSNRELLNEIEEAEYSAIEDKKELLQEVIDNFEILTEEDISEEDREQFEASTIAQLTEELEEQKRQLFILNKPREDMKKKILREM